MISPVDAHRISTTPTDNYYDGLGVRPTDGVLFATPGNTDAVFTINPANGLTTFVGSTGQGNVSDLAFRVVVCGTPTPTPTASPTCTPSSFHVLIAYSDIEGPPATLQSQILAEPGVTGVDLFDASSSTPTLAQLQPYNIVVAFSNNPYSDAVAMGNVLADYADTGGVVVGLNFDWFGPPFGLAGRWITGGYTPFNFGPTNFSTSCLGTYDTTHPLMQGISAGSLCAFFRHTLTLSPGAVSVALYQDNEQLVAYKTNNGHTGVGINAYLGENPMDFSGPFGRVIVNAGRWLISQPCGTPTPTPTASATATATATATASATPTAPPSATPTATPSCTPPYVFTVGTGTIVPGTTDTGNHIDDGTTAITLPFAYTLYGQSFTTANISSNGNLQFVSNSTLLTNACPLPSATFDMPIMPHWDDLRTDQVGTGCTAYGGVGCGVFTSISGTAPNRIFNIEWRTVYFGANTTRANFELRLYEGQSRFDMVYGEVAQTGSSATVGVQQGTGAQFTQYECNTVGTVNSGLQLVFTEPPCGSPTPTATPTCSAGGTPGPWTQAAPVAIDHYGGFMDSDGTFAYEGGGYSFSASGNINQFGKFNPATNTWTPLAPVPDLNNGEASGVYAPNVNKLFVFGGENIATATVVNTTRIYDIVTNTWSTGAPMPDVRAFMASGYFNGKIYLVGGYNTGNVDPSFGQVWEYDPVLNTWNTTRMSMPATLGGPGFGIINGHMYVAGGRDID